jgi:hypothetical protein
MMRFGSSQKIALAGVLIASGFLIAAPAKVAIATSTVSSVIVANYQKKFD